MYVNFQIIILFSVQNPLLMYHVYIRGGEDLQAFHLAVFFPYPS